MNDTKILWTQETWNPMSGCQQVSSGCAYCYAKTLAENKRGTSAFPHGFDLTIRPHKLKEPFALKESSLIFVNSMSDLFWDAVPESYRDQIIDVIEATPQHQYQVLTKRPEVMLEYSKRRKLPYNFWAGATIEGNAVKDRLNILKQVKASLHFVSCEPLLSPLDLDWSGINWVITGGESGRHLLDPKKRELRSLAMIENGKWVPRPDREDWVRCIRDGVKSAGGSFFHKQWGGVLPHSAGRTLDGRTWDEFPRLPDTGKVNPKLEQVKVFANA